MIEALGRIAGICAGVILAAMLSGCAPGKPPPPLVADHAALASIRHYQGTPLSGTVLREPAAFSPDEALAVDVTFVALEKSPQGIDPLGVRARLIVASHGANPVRSTGGLTSTGAYARGDEAVRLAHAIEAGEFGRGAVVGKVSGALPMGVTARCEITDSGTPDVTLPSGLGHRRFGVQICRPQENLFTRKRPPATAPATQPGDAAPDIEPETQPATRPAVASAAMPATAPASRPAVKISGGVDIEMAIELDDLAPQEPITADTLDAKNAAPAMILHLETVMLDTETILPREVKDGRPTAVVAVPFTFRHGRNKSVAAIIRLGRGSKVDAAHRAACTLAAKDLKTSYEAALADAVARPPASPDEATVLDLLQSITKPQTRRSATAYLAAWSGARYCEDVALSADEKLLAELTANFPKELQAIAKDKPVVGWRLDRLTLDFLLKRLSDNKLPPELQAILSDRAGEAGRHASAMEEVLRDVRGPVDLDERLVAINRLYLEDSSPGSRARAYDWLKNRNRHEEPAGYQPLSPSRERREALDKDQLARAAAATQPANQPTGVP